MVVVPIAEEIEDREPRPVDDDRLSVDQWGKYATESASTKLRGSTQNRLRQFIFGGTTRYILSNATAPVFVRIRSSDRAHGRYILRRMTTFVANVK
jgi:nucleotide-binding universal stress UspA family protein